MRSCETEIEKCREESNWKKAVELAQQLKARSPQHESLAHFLIGEGKLEAYLEEYPPIKDNSERAQRELSEAKDYLSLATDEAGKKAGVALDSYLLLGKLHYACGNYDDALKNYRLAELNTLTERELPVRSLRIVAESYAIKGLCLEQTAIPGSTSRYKQAEREAEMVRSLELSSELTMLYLQRSRKPSVGPTLDTALLRAPAIHLQHGRVQSAVQRYREMLSAVEAPATQSLRLTVARQLSEVFLRAPMQEYKAPYSPVYNQPLSGTLTRRREDYVSEGPWKPKKYASLNQFIPSTCTEEMLLCLLVGEAMAARDAVLSQSPEFAPARTHSLLLATALCDLLVMAAVRWGLLCLILESLERAMKFSFGEKHVWRQRSLAMAAAANNDLTNNSYNNIGSSPCKTSSPSHKSWSGVRAHSVVLHYKTLAEDDAAVRLVGATNCYNINYIEEGIELAEEALLIEEKNEGDLLARAYMQVAVGYQMKAQKTNSRIDKDAANEKSLKLLTKSVQLDDNDYLSLYYLALQYMYMGMYGEAMEWCKASLSARSCWGGTLKMLTCLWSTRGPTAGIHTDHAENGALCAALLSRECYPGAVWPLTALLTAGSDCQNSQHALAAGRELLALLRGTPSDGETPYLELDARSDSPHDHSHRDAASVRAESAGVFKVELALSEGASSNSPHHSSPMIANAWLLLAQLCLKINKIPLAWECVNEAASLQPYSHLVLYTRGLVHAARHEWEEARHSFQNALAVHPTHLDTIINLGSAYYELGWLRLAEKMLREAVVLEPGAPHSWTRLARVMAALGEHDAAADCAAAAAMALTTNINL